MNDIIFNNEEIIARACNPALTTFERHQDDRDKLYDAQDVIVLNLQRACVAAIDLAMHMVRILNLGLPKESREALVLLHNVDVIDATLAARLQKMIAFRNIAVHDSRATDWDIVRGILATVLADLWEYSRRMVKRYA